MSEYDLAKEIFSRSLPDELFVSQPSEAWKGEFSLPETVAHYYRELGAFNVNIENYGNSIFLPGLSDLWDYQAGYRYHPDTKERFEDWDDDWLVIADQGADPFIYSRQSGKILYDQHGRGVWEPSEFFSTLPEMVIVFALMGEIVVNAGEDFTDEDEYIHQRFIGIAKERISRALNSDPEAEAILDSFGWSGRA